MTGRLFIDAGDVAAMAGYPSRNAFLADRRRLEDEFGFPRPLAHRRRPLLWRLEAVRQWTAVADRSVDEMQALDLGLRQAAALQRARSA